MASSGFVVAKLGSVLAIPGDRPAQAFLEVGACLEAEPLFGPRHVESSPRLTVRLARVPADLPAETGVVHDEMNEVLDADLPAATEIDRFPAVVLLRGEHDCLGRIVDVEEL